MKKIFVLLLGCMFIMDNSFAQQRTMDKSLKNSITITLDGVQAGDTALLKAYRPKQETIDTSIVREGGQLSFHSDTLLPVGMYCVDIAGRTLDFFLSEGEPQSFSIQYNLNEGLASAQFTGSPENQALAGYLRFMRERQMRRQQLQQRIQSNGEHADSLALLDVQMETLIREVKNKWTEIETAHSGKMIALFISSIREPEPAPFTVADSSANIDSLQQNYYYTFFRDHFFDNYQFSSPYLLQMPFYSQALTTYFTRLLKPERQETTGQMARLMEKLKDNKPLYRYTVRELYDLYKNVPYPELEGLYLEVGENYIVGRPEMWDSAYVDKVAFNIKLAAMNPVGDKATELKLSDLAGNAMSLYDVQAAYTVLYFYNPQCGACAEITPKVHKTYQDYKNKGVQVFAVYVDRDKDVWMKYVMENKYLDWINAWDADETADIYGKYDLHAIPMIYLLDKDKVVVVKDLQQSSLELWLNQLTSAE
ncbi:MAG: redoxin domain-containing protein [Prevotellaceae bacterium]|jgi:thiol-disulfide isomerase/thioredoxin|nr:redoxin domain-containing protein [Prevotellaceae bacterium]